jgi:TRAP-type C4-dicarboxylate transport system permease small subunit
MTTLDKAMFICGVIVAVVSIPFMLLAVPAGLQVLAGDWTVWNGLIDQGWPQIGFYAALLCCVVLILGAAYE